ncbi:MAG: rhodanese-like domain-containing protein [Clostridiales bacterium]|jgi:rhodanese-related sulfurtransferase|nr:rhodanese-like domain-containing protein [Clostridiales bacterium]
MREIIKGKPKSGKAPLFLLAAVCVALTIGDVVYTRRKAVEGAESPAAGPFYRKISSARARELMTGDAVILDVRTPAEFEAGHIKNAVNVPQTRLMEEYAEIFPDKEALILIYCRSGKRSAASAKFLAEKGYTNLYDFGGIEDWLEEMERPEGAKNEESGV